jgi:hypothetical protein
VNSINLTFVLEGVVGAENARRGAQVIFLNSPTLLLKREEALLRVRTAT